MNAIGKVFYELPLWQFCYEDVELESPEIYVFYWVLFNCNINQVITFTAQIGRHDNVQAKYQGVTVQRINVRRENKIYTIGLL